MSQSNQLPLTEINPKYSRRVLQETMNRYRIVFTALSDGCHPHQPNQLSISVQKYSQLGVSSCLSSTSRFNTPAWPWLGQSTAQTSRIFTLAESFLSSKTWKRASNVGSHTSLWKLAEWRASTVIASASFWKAFFFSDARTRYLLAVINRE